jgi:ubiquinone/menaquinone biosynthesis C-methylase UbiE
MSVSQLEPQSFFLSADRPKPSPERFFSTMASYQNTAMLKAAIDLDLFTAIGDGDSTVPDLARQIQGSERGVRMLCDALTVSGFLTKSEERYGLTLDSHVFLDRKSRVFIGDATRFLTSEVVTSGFRDLAAVVRSGRPLAEKPFPGTEHPIWVEFARSMAAIAYVPAQEMAKLLHADQKIRVLDIAAGHGMYGLAIAQTNSQAEVVAQDWPSVLPVASENAKRFGVLDRFSVLPGDALEINLGNGFDVIVVANLLHHWAPETIVRFHRKVHAALGPGGKLVIVEFAPNDDRLSPPIAAQFVLPMLANTIGGDAYTVAEHRRMLQQSGFRDCEAHALLPTPATAIIAPKL